MTEVLVVVALLSILVIAAAPRLVVPESLQVGVPARQIAADLRLAQRLAIAKRAIYLLEFAPLVPPYTSYSVHPQGGPPEADYPKSIDSAVTVNGPQQFVFQPGGSTATGGTVTLASGPSTATVQVIMPTGAVTVTGP